MYSLARELLVTDWIWRVGAEQLGQLCNLGSKRVVVDVEISSEQQRLHNTQSIRPSKLVCASRFGNAQVSNSWLTSC